MPPRDGRRALIHPELLDLPERRIDGDAKTTGAAKYTADLAVPGALEAAFVRSPYPHARIVSIETGRARALAGVRAVLTGADVRGQRLGRRLQDWPVLCWDRVLFIGDRVAAVAADTRQIAEEAVRLISVEYEELPPLLDMDAALRPDAAVLHPDAASYRFLEGRGERPPVPHPNQQGHVVETHGDVEAAFARAARIFEHEFTTPRIHQAPLEGYPVPAARHEAATVYTNNVPGGHMRAPGQPQNVFASESHLDLLARELGIAPLEMRRRNVARAGDPTTTGEPWHGPDLRALLDRAAAEIRADQPRPNGRGIGFALGVRHVGRGSTTISLRLERDGTIEARTGGGDQGGGQHTLIQRIVAATLGVDAVKVRVRRLSTEGPQDPGLGGSRVTPVHGGAALAAAKALKDKLG